MKRFIKVKFQKEGIHFFPGADTDPKYATGGWDDVSFLGRPHRHVFHFVVWIQVGHDNRELEFFQVKRQCERFYSAQGALDVDHKSCEMLADDLYNCLIEVYGDDREYRIEVTEDDENGSYTEYPIFGGN